MGELRVDAAIEVGEPMLLVDLVQERSLSDDGRLRLSTELLRLDAGKATAIAEEFARTARNAATAVRLADMLWRYDPDTTLQILDATAWPTDRTVRSVVRLKAVTSSGRSTPPLTICLEGIRK